MSYYQGDFYQGDPGFFSFLGKAVKTAAGIGASFFPGGGLASKAVGALAKIPGGSAATAIATRAGGAIVKHPVLSAAGAAGVVGLAGAGVGRRTGRMGSAGVGPASMAGFRGGAGAAFGRKRRRMHVTNVKALRRAIRRCTGFAHLAKRVLRFTSPRPPRGRAVFKHRRRKKVI